MRRLPFKLLLGLVVWYEAMAELGLHADTAFLLTLALFAGFWFARGLAGQLINMVGPLTFGLLFQAVLWMGLLWWLAPAVFHAMPFVFDLLIVLGLAMFGARCRFLYSKYRLTGRRFVPADYSTAIVIGLLVGLAICMFLIHSWGSVWPLVAYALLPSLPFAFGWRMGPVVVADRLDARIGDSDTFRDAGLSDDR